MLQTIRDLVSGWLAAAIFIMLIIPFAFWGINYYFGKSGDVVAAEVNGASITLRDYQRALQDLRQRLQSLATAMSPAEQDVFLKKRTLETLIERQLLHQADAKLDLRVSNDQVRSTIEGVPYFQGESGFDAKLYQSSIGAMGMSPARFEAQVREDMLAEQLQSALIESAFITDTAARHLAQIRGEQRDLRYAVLSADAGKDKISVSDSDVQKHYDEKGPEFMEPERVRLAYIELAADTMTSDVEITEDALRQFYDENRANYGMVEQREIRQLLVTLPEKPTPAQVEKAEARADEILQELDGGKSMEEIATGQDPKSGTSADYSEFGFLSHGVLEPAVDEAAFALKEGEHSKPVRSKFGIHIVQVTRIKAGETKAFEEARSDVEKDYRRKEAEKRFFDVSDRLAALVFENPDSLDKAAEELGLKIQESGLIGRDYSGSDVLANPKILAAAFGEDVLHNGNNSELIEVDNTHAVTLRVLEHVAQHKKPLADVREQVVTRIKFDRAGAQTRAQGEAILKKLKGGAAAADIAAEFGIEWHDAQGVKLDDPNVNQAVLRAAFSTGRPSAGATLYDGVSLGTGDFAVVAVTAVHEPSPDALDDNAVKAVRDELRQNDGTRVWANYITDLRRTADVTVYEDRIQ